MRDDQLLKGLTSLAEALSPDPFSPNPTGGSDDSVDGHVRIGKVRQSGAVFGLNLDELAEHTLIA